jgi:hypothetical protein
VGTALPAVHGQRAIARLRALVGNPIVGRPS